MPKRMWHLRLSGGVEISERQVRTWDNVPKEVENRYGGLADRISFGIRRTNGKATEVVEKLRAI